MTKSCTRLCETATAIALFGIMALTLLDVLGRKFLAHSISGSLELTELLMVIVIFAGLPLVSTRGEHVEFDSLDAITPTWVGKVQVVLVNLFCALLLLGLGWLMLRTGARFMESGETTAQLGIAKAPFIYAMSGLCAIAGLTHLILACRQRESGTHEQATAL